MTGARKEFFALRDWYAQQAAKLELTDCEGCTWVWECTTRAMWNLSTEMVVRGAWLNRVPWRVAEADDPQEAGECALQLESIPDDRLDLYLIELKHTIIPDLEAGTSPYLQSPP